jgi:hypothetical protein
MKQNWILIFLIISQFGFSQQYDSVYLEKDSIDLNNQVYKIGNVYVFDYEIIEQGKSFKLSKNSRTEFGLVLSNSDSIGIDKIHLLVKPIADGLRQNENQTEISYLESPQFGTWSTTGVVDNVDNVWIHPYRRGFFSSLETCPFPFITKSRETGYEWSDAMLIGEGWGNEKWGKWEGELL